MNTIKDNTDRYFPGQNRNEELIMYTRLHPIILLPHLIGFIVSLLLLPAFVYGINQLDSGQSSPLSQALMLTLFTGYSYYFHRFFMRIYNYYLNIIVLTNYRVIKFEKTVFLSNNKDTIDLYKIQDLKKDQSGLLCTLFDFGTLTIEVSAIHETKSLHHLPNPEKWFHALNGAKRSYIEYRRHSKPETKQEEHYRQSENTLQKPNVVPTS